MKTQKEIKQDYFDRVYEKAELIECACGCGEKLKNKDRYGRDKKFVNGHNGRKYEDPKQYQKEYRQRNKKKLKAKQRKFERDRRIKLIKMGGGFCNRCGFLYDESNGAAFHFHHKDPKTREFRISSSQMWRSWRSLIKEFKKCELLCSNCHFIEHSAKY